MSSETDHPRQRTVAELLAQHGDGATGRRRRRREPDAADAPPPAGPEFGRRGLAPPPDGGVGGLPARSILREPVPRDATEGPLPRGGAPIRELRPRASREAAWSPQGPAQPRRLPERPDHTDELRPEELRERRPEAWQERPEPPRERPAPPWAPQHPEARAAVPEAPYSTVPEAPYSAVPEAPFEVRPPRAEPLLRPVRPVAPERPTENIPRIREEVPDTEVTGPISRDELADLERGAGPPGAADDTDDDAGPQTQTWDGLDDDWADEDWPDDGSTRAGRRPGAEEPPAGLAEPDVVSDDDPAEPRRRLGRGQAAAAPGWPAVLGQWLAGAIAGAALWVGFRFLWEQLTFVAIAGAVVVTVGLVVVVRALLRNDDMRTTVFAVLVGLLLTVSPVILVLLGR